MNQRCLSAAGAALLTLVSSAGAFAQRSSTASISGVAVDSQGAVFPGANVVIKNDGTGETFTTVTTAAGTFLVPALITGKYTVTVSVQGFKTAVLQNVEVSAGLLASVRVTLEVGDVTEQVTVQANSELVQTTAVTSPAAFVYKTRWVDRDGLSEWVRLLGYGDKQGSMSSLTEGSRRFLRIQPANKFVLSMPDVLAMSRDDWPGLARLSPILDPAKHAGVRLRIRHNSPLRFVSGYWAHRSSGEQRLGMPNYGGLPCFRGHSVPGDGNWHGISLRLSESPFLLANDPVVLIGLSFSSAEGMAASDESAGWSAFESANQSVTARHYFDIELIELLLK